ADEPGRGEPRGRAGRRGRAADRRPALRRPGARRRGRRGRPSSRPTRVARMTDQTQQATADFHALAGAVLDELLERHPEWATILGDHRFDDRLGDQSRAGRAEELAWAGRRLGDLEAVD